MAAECHTDHAAGANNDRPRIAKIFARHRPTYEAACRPSGHQRRVIAAIIACRTPVLGGRMQACEDCGDAVPLYNSCRNRHCPTCQNAKQAQWLARREQTILPTPYFHVVFTLPAGLREITRQNPRTILALLMRCAAETLLKLAEDPKRLGAHIGITSVLHTWTRTLTYHPHVHCIVTGGGLTADGQRWLPARQGFLFSVRVLQKLFRGRFMAALRHLYDEGALHLRGPLAELRERAAFRRLKETLYDQRWVVYAKQPFGGPQQVFAYLGRYTHRVGITNARIREATDDRVTFTTRQARTTTLAPVEFMRRLTQHILPPRFVKMRHYGLYAGRHVKRKVAQALVVLHDQARPQKSGSNDEKTCLPTTKPARVDLWGTRLRVMTPVGTKPCQRCGSSRVVQRPFPRLDTS
jgi:hypothetical protein